MPSPLRTHLVPLLALLFAAALGWLVFKKPEPPPTTHPSVPPQPQLPTSTSARAENAPAPSAPQPQLPTSTRVAEGDVITGLYHAWESAEIPDDRDAYLAELSALLQTADLPGLIRELPSDVLDLALGLPAFQTWLHDHPGDALTLLAARGTAVAESRIRPIIAAWLAKDPVVCSQHLRALPAGPWREQTLALAAQLSIESDPANAASWAALLTPGPRQNGLLDEIATAWTAKNPAKAAAWISSLPDSPLRQQLHATHALALAESDPAQAAAWLLQTVPPGELRDNAINRLASVWAETDPALVSTWLDRLPDSETRQEALRTVLNAWTRHDRPAAQAWILRLPPGPARDEAQSHLDSLPAAPSSPAQ